jgi:hypothetical protein
MLDDYQQCFPFNLLLSLVLPLVAFLFVFPLFAGNKKNNREERKERLKIKVV